MTKKGSFFKLLRDYFGGNILAGFGWLWVAVMPAVGSSYLLYSYERLDQLSLYQATDYLIYTLLIGLILGLALMPTTLMSIACGFFWGWKGFIPLVLGYILANVLGYLIGKKLNSGFFDRLYDRYPDTRDLLKSKIDKPGQLIFFVRISPVVPFAISNFLFASLRVPLAKVLIYGIPGMLPRTLIAFITGLIANSFLGAKESLSSPGQIGLVVFLLLASGIGIYHQLRNR